MLDALRKPLLRLVLGPALLTLTPLVVFLKHNSYGLARPETLAVLAAFGSLGALLGLLGTLAGRYGAVVVTAALVTLTIDVQWDAPEAWTSIVGVFIACTLLAWWLRDQLLRLVAPIGLVMLVATLVVPGREPVPKRAWPSAHAKREASPPLLVHLIIDEQIGIEGIPRRFDRGGRISGALTAFYEKWGFQLFGRAFSRYYNTSDAVPNLLNLHASRRTNRYVRYGRLTKNAYFEKMTARGYRIHVYQTDYLDFCTRTPRIDLASCSEYKLERLHSIESAELDPIQKASMLTASFVRLSFVLSALRDAYGDLRITASAYDIALPPLDEVRGRVSTVSVMPMIDRLEAELVEARPGSLYFAHLMLPHYPYAYRSDCRLRPKVNDWLNGFSPFARPRRNTNKSRAFRYPRYLEQVLCTHRRLDALFERMREAGTFDDAIILVHSDHGSRLDRGPPSRRFRKYLRRRDYVDAFSTLFAARIPGRPASYDRRFLALDELFNRFVKRHDFEPIPGERYIRTVYLKGGARMLARTMPVFAYGRVASGRQSVIR